MIRRAAVAGGFLLLGATLRATPVRAASIADSVQKHVKEGLDESTQKANPEKKPPAKAPPPRAEKRPPPAPRRPPPRGPSNRPAPREGTVDAAPAEEPPPAEEKPKGPQVPIRVINKNLRIDPQVGGGYRGWVLQPYRAVDVGAQSYFTWSVEVKAKILRLITLHRGYYESNGLAGPRHSGAVVATEAGANAHRAAWLLGAIGVPITHAWEPVIRYETRAFQTTAIPNRPVRIVSHDTPASTDLSTIPETTGRLTMVSGFETFVAGVQYNHSEDSSALIDPNAGPLPPFYFGVGLIQYSKPYQVSVGDAVLDDILFDARFRGAGLAFGFELPSKPDHVTLQLASQVGLGEVRLLDDLTLNELLPQSGARSGLRPPEWLIGYVQGDVTVGYIYPLLRTAPSVLVSIAATGGGATFFYFKTQAEQGEKVSAPPLNWDFLWGVRAAVTVPL